MEGLLTGRARAKRTDATSTSAAWQKTCEQTNPKVIENKPRNFERSSNTVKKVVHLAPSVTLN